MKSEFLTPLHTEYLGYIKGVQWWKLLAPLIYYSEIARDFITVPTGFVCDFASVKRVPILWLLWGGKGHRAATIHDFLYREGTYGRKGADGIFLEALKATDYRLWSRYPMFWGVYLFGWTAYKPVPGCLDYRVCAFRRDTNLCPECEANRYNNES
jgi:hypothetical protein